MKWTNALRLLIASTLLVLLAWIAQRIAGTEIVQTPSVGGPDASQLATGTAIGVLLLGSWFVGKMFQSIGLPKITGFLVFGMLMGPSALAIIRERELQDLELVNELAIALIALAAGGKLSIPFLRRSLRLVLSVVATQLVAVLAVSSLVGFAVLRYGGFLPGLGMTELAWLGLILGILALAPSPAIVIAMITETRASGSFSNILLSVVMCLDVVLIVLFTVAIGLAAPVVLGTLGDGSDAVRSGLSEFGPVILLIAWHLIGSIIFGAIVGMLMASYVHAGGGHLPMAIPLVCFAMALLSGVLGFETLLVALAAGVLMRNVWPATSEPVFEAVQRLSLPVYCVFFAVAGCKVQLDALAIAWYWVLALCGGRALAMYVGTTAGAALGGAAPTTRRWLWTPFIAQAGVSVALVGIFERTFREVAGVDVLYTVLMATIAVNELIGPILCKLGLERGDTRAPR